MLTWLRKASIGTMAAATVMVCSLLVVTPAQAAPTSGQADVSWEAATVTAGEVGTQAICSTPTRLTNQAIWYDCTVFTGEYIQAWIICDGWLYVSPYIGEGSWYIIGTCPPGTLRDDEGIYYYD